MIDPAAPEKVLKEFEFQFGVLDPEGCWIGNDDGPLLFGDEMLARAAATIMGERMCDRYAYRARLYAGGPKVMRDEVQFKIAAYEAVRRAER